MEQINCQCNWTVLGAIGVIAFLLMWKNSRSMRYYMNYAIYVGAMSVIIVGLVPVFLPRPRNVKNYLFGFSITKHVTKLLGITWELRNGEILAEERGGVIVANHQSIFDVLGMSNIWATVGKCAIVSKKEVFYFLPIGLTAWLAGTVFIDRVHPKTAHKQLEEAATLMNRDKTKLWMFPEGTRNKSGVSLLPFKKGAFRIAITCQVPLLPVVYSPYYFLDGDKLEFGKGKMIITALPAIPTTGLTLDDVDDLMDRTRKIMLEAYNAVCEEVKRR